MSRSAYYRSLIATETPLLLDEVAGGYIAFSLRKLRTAYTGACIRVQRTDLTEQDIGFVNNQLDTAALLSFCGSGNGSVVVGYDQMGFSNISGRTNIPPRIVENGVLVTKNGKPTMKFAGVAGANAFTLDNAAASILHQANKAAVLWVGTINTPGTPKANSLMGSYRPNRGEVGILFAVDWDESNIYSDARTCMAVRNGGYVSRVISGANSFTYGQTTMWLSLHDLANATASQRNTIHVNNNSYQNNTQTGSPSAGVSSRGYQIGVQPVAGGSYLDGTFDEFIIFNTDQNPNVTTIKNNVFSFYSIS